MTTPFRVLVVDDSAISREALRQALEVDPALRVAAEATTGEEAIALAQRVAPDLITMDLNMPGMGGLKAIESIMRDRPTPIVVISERSSSGGVDLNYEAMSRGALELVPKAAVFGVTEQDVRRFAERMRLVAEARTLGEVSRGAVPGTPLSSEAPLVLGLGASTGGPRALARLLGELPSHFGLPIALVQHMAEDFFDSFVRFLGDATRKPVELASDGEFMKPGRVYVAPPRHELFIRPGLVMRLGPSPRDALISPSVDSLFFSLATTFKGRSLGVLLTGMGDDGAQGLLRMRRMGARTVAQDRQSSAVYGMPRAAVELGAAEAVLPLDDIAGWLVANEHPRVEQAKPARTVVVLDDEPTSLESTAAALRQAGLTVVALDNPLMLATTLRKNTVDLVVLESELTTMRGALVLASVRGHGHAGVRVVLYSRLTGGALEDRRTECEALGAVTKNERPRLLELVLKLVG